LRATGRTAEAINDAIKRRAHAVEFTASKEYDLAKVTHCLRAKVANYARIVETQ
jgi:hypothetical protein